MTASRQIPLFFFFRVILDFLDYQIDVFGCAELPFIG